MNAIKTILSVGLCCCMALDMVAQEKVQSTGKPVASWEKNWYLEVGGGAQVLFTKDANRLSFGERITPALSLTAGRWFNPYWGIRLQAQGYSMNGFVSVENATWNDPVRNQVDVWSDGSFPYFMRYMDLHVDAQISLANIIGGYKHAQKWDVMAALGIGYFHAFPHKGTTKENSFSGHLSVMAKWRLPKGFDLNLEVQSAIMPDEFNGRETGHPSGMVGANIGVSYHFGKIALKNKQKREQYRKSAQSSLDEEALRKIIREELRNTTGVNLNRDTVYVVKEVEGKPSSQVSANLPFTLAAIQFGLGKHTPAKGQDLLLVNVAEYLKKNPNAKVRIEGYADAKTGHVKRNRFLSMQRAVEVFNILKEKYGIDEKQMNDVQGIGADFQPYEESAWNRVVLIKVIQ